MTESSKHIKDEVTDVPCSSTLVSHEITTSSPMVSSSTCPKNTLEIDLPTLPSVVSREYTAVEETKVIKPDKDDMSEEPGDAAYEPESSDVSESDTESNPDSIHVTSNDITTEPNNQHKKKRIPPAKNAREFVARLHKKQDETTARQANKHKRKQALSGETTASKRSRSACTHDAGVLSRLLGYADEAEPSVPAMPEIGANTHAQQFAMLKHSIPAGSDIRRTKSQGQDLKEAVKLFGYKRVKAMADGTWLLSGMASGLYNSQLTAVAWMVKRELGRERPFGGIMADDMGMGKTLMSLACVVGNPPAEIDDGSFRGTLIIVPNMAVAKQWKGEIEKHIRGEYADWATIFDSKADVPLCHLASFWFIISPIHEVRGQFSAVEAAKRDDPEGYLELLKQRKKGQLFQVKWYRVILDEAHSIKNTSSKNKKACCSLSAKHSWALTGTPLSNSTAELLPYLKFIGCEIDDKDSTKFIAEYMKEKKSTSKLQALLSMVMYRRTKNDSFLGMKIVNIPSSQTLDIQVSLSREEGIIYKFIKSVYLHLAEEAEMQNAKEVEDCSEEATFSMEKKLKDQLGKIRMDQTAHLRMAVSHTYNIENLLRTMANTKHIQNLRVALRKVAGKQTILDQLLSVESVSLQLQQYASGLDSLRGQTDGAMGGLFEFDRLLGMIQDEREAAVSECSVCGSKNPNLPVKIEKCGHIYCKDCHYQDWTSMHSASDQDKGDIKCRSPGCTSDMVLSQHFQTLATVVDKARKDPKFSEPGIDGNRVTLSQPPERVGCLVAGDYLKDLSQLPSSRLTVAMAVLSSWWKDYPDDKIIVFAQFISTAKVMGRMLKLAHMPFLYYFGDVSAVKKEQALNLFKTDCKYRVMLMGLQSGGQSLNITCANRVIMVDPWWNKTAEQQAIGRVHRITQTKECHIVRIFTTADMDEKLRGLQEIKSEEIDNVLQDEGHTPTSLSKDQELEVFDFTQGKKKAGAKTGAKRKGGSRCKLEQ